MWEAAMIYVRSAGGWTEIPTGDANHIFQYGDTVMTVFPDGSWRTATPDGLKQQIRSGNLNNLEQFLNDFSAINL